VRVWQAGDWHWDRGFAERAHLPAAVFLAYAVAIFAAHPVTHVSLTDRSPMLDAGRWGWHLPYDRTPMSEVSAILPAELFALLEGMLNPDDPAGDEFAYYAKAWLAWDALSRACVRYGRAKAGLPPLPGQDSGDHTIPHER
jgi:hypothetical protein